MTNTMSMLPNDHHPGPRCSCRDCQRRYPELSDDAPTSPPSKKKLYAERDIIEQMQHYVDHVEAMTAEGLHSKSDIAAELAHRDMEIERLQRHLDQRNEQIDGYERQLGIIEADATITIGSEIERLQGIRPELPPRPPDGEGLPRYGIRWNGPEEPLAVPMGDGYWTPWHLASRASHEPAPEHFDEHDAGIIRDLEAMAANQLAGFWPQALAIGALRLIRQRSAQPPPAEQPFAWTIPGRDNADMNGFIPVHIERHGEFTKPLYEKKSGDAP